jgi:tetratricopeptide (TPR) repeat protein
LRERGYDAIHVINRTNVWYQHPEMPDALRAIRDAASRYAEVFTYGSSMGGYAAIRFAEAVGAKTAIAISPQYSVVPKVVPFDRRWRAVARRIDFSRESPRPGSTMVEPLVFYDPRDLDARHFELIARAFPRTTGVRLWHAGHPAGAYLSEAGVLTSAITAILERRFDARTFEKEARAKRRLSGQYFFTLARRQPPWRAEAKLRLARMAVERREDAAYLIYLSLLTERTGDLCAAEALLRRAADVLPDHPAPIRALGVFLLRGARFEEARAETGRLFAIDPARDEFERLARLAAWGSGDPRRLPEISRRSAEMKPGATPRRTQRWVDLGVDWLTRHGLEAAALGLARPHLLSCIARKTSLKGEMRLFDEWRPPPAWKRLIKRLRFSAPSSPNLRDPR